MKAAKQPATEASAKKKQSAMSLDQPKWHADLSQHRTLGLRAHDETEGHFPTTSLMVPDEAMCRRWAAERMRSGKHADCGFRIEEVMLDLTTFHVLSQCGELPDDPLVGPIEWEEAEPFDLGPLWEQMTIEEMQRMKDLPPAALEAAKLALRQAQPIYVEGKPDGKAEGKANGEKVKTESKRNGEKVKNGKPADKPSNGKPAPQSKAEEPHGGSIGSSHPAPKPGSSEKSAKGKGGGKSAPAKRQPPHKLRAASKPKHMKRA